MSATYRLGSNRMVYAPGVIRWAIGYFRTDEDHVIDVVTAGWAVPRPAAKALLSKRVPFTIEGEDVVFSIPE